MTYLIWIGAALSLIGLCGLAWCIVQAIRARAAALDEAAMKARLQRLVAWNMGALLLSILGLMIVVVGIFLSPAS